MRLGAPLDPKDSKALNFQTRQVGKRCNLLVFWGICVASLVRLGRSRWLHYKGKMNSREYHFGKISTRKGVHGTSRDKRDIL